VVSFDQMGPVSLRPTPGAGWAPRGRPERQRADYNRRQGTRYVFGALDVHADRLRTRLGTQVRLRASEAPTTGFRGLTMSLVVAQPSTVDSLIGTALDAGATSLKPVAKGFWGYGGVVQAPDGAIWKVATSSLT
jgi:hypothetical protein